jgi:hypothetical protein
MKKQYKKFEDLDFKLHEIGNGKHAVMMFPNGYGVSVVRFMSSFVYGSYTSNENEWN